MTRRAWLARSLVALLILAAPHLATAADSIDPAAATDAGRAALHQLRTFATTGRVLHIGAHPDDENTELIAYLSCGRGYDTAYLSITRGDGGQNILGPEFDEKLGVARTQELLAARRIDGGRQFFTRAIDFGFSKTPEETLSIWNHREVLSDVVRVIRQFRPDVVVTRFPIPPGSGGHGHHTASAILAVEAFKAAGDPNEFPEQLKQGLTPWQPKRIVWDRGSFFRPSELDSWPTVKVDIAGRDPVTGEAFTALAARSRAMHKTQGFGEFANRGSASGPRLETFVLLGGERAANDFMDGVDTTWARVPGGEEIGKLTTEAIAAFNVDRPAASVPALLAIRKKLAALKSDFVVEEKRAELDKVLRYCLQLSVESECAKETIVPGETQPASASASLDADIPLRWVAVEYGGKKMPINATLVRGKPQVFPIDYAVSKSAAVTQPYWLREPSTVGMYTVSDPQLIGRPENPPDLPVTYTFEIDGLPLTVTDKLVKKLQHPGKPVAIFPVVIVPRVALRFDPGVALFRPDTPAEVELEIVAGRPNTSGTIGLEAPHGWRVSAPQPFSIEREMGTARVTFEVTPPREPSTGALGARARTADGEWNDDAFTLHYAHIPIQLLQFPAKKRIVSASIGTRGHAVGYVPGAGDDVASAIKQLGYDVKELKTADITAENLRQFDTVVIGVRAFNTRADLAPTLPALFDYVAAGGTVVCQYNWAQNLKVTAFAPYPLKLSGNRVTDEHAPVTLLAPDHPVLNQPNKITAADFDGWVQERGIYFPSEWDPHFVPILAMNDPGEQPLKGALLVAPHGKGYFVYTSLVFFRELPAGVPGAYRLFANLLSLGK